MVELLAVEEEEGHQLDREAVGRHGEDLELVSSFKVRISRGFAARSAIDLRSFSSSWVSFRWEGGQKTGGKVRGRGYRSIPQ